MRLNYDLARRGVWVERVIILRGELWSPGELLPAREIRPWIQEQHDHGIHVSLVREVDLQGEPDLLCDFGIYGNRATGIEELDEQSRTVRFVLHFDRPSIQLARDRLERISLYTKRYGDLLELSPS